MNKPREVFQMMNSHVNQLGQRLAEVEQQTAAEVTQQKADYEHRLQEQADEITRIKDANMKLSIEIQDLKRSSAGLRGDAKREAAVNQKLRDDLETLQKNMTSAQEFSSLAL